MRKRPSATAAIASTALFFSLGGAGLAASQRVVPLAFRVTKAHVASRCTQPVPDSRRVAVWVYVNGREIHSSATRGAVFYYAGNDTMVKLRAHPHGGPICARATTWLPRANVRVRFRVL